MPTLDTQKALEIVFSNFPEKLLRVDRIKIEVSKILGGIPDDFQNALREFKDNPENEVCMVPIHGLRYVKTKLKGWKNLHNAHQNRKIVKAKNRIRV